MLSAAAFVLFCLVCMVLAFVRHPIWGLYFYFATTFVYPPARWWEYLLPEMRWALLAAGVVILAVVFHRGKLKPKPSWIANPPAILLTAYAAWMWLQTPWALDFETHVNGATIFTKYLLAFWFVYRVADTTERVRDVLLAHVLGCALLGIYCYLQGRSGGRLDGVGGPGIDDANTLGMYLVTGAIVAVGLILTQTDWRRYLALACLPLIGNGFVLANSRGAFLGLVAGGLVLALCKAKQHRPVFWVLAVAGLLGMAAVVDKTFIERMYTIEDVTSENEDADMSARSRMVVAKAQLQMFLDHPMGVGHRGTAALSPQYIDRRWLSDRGMSEDSARSSHNTFLTTLVEQGVIGAALFLCLVAWVFSAGLRIRRMNGPGDDPTVTTLSAAACGALAVVLVSGNSADFLLAEVQFWMIAVLVSAFHLRASTQPSKLDRGGATEMRRLPA